MAISSTKPITILDAVESVLVAQALQLLGWEAYNRANGGTLEHLRPIVDRLRETGQARLSDSGHKVGESLDGAHDAWVTTREAAERTGLNVRGVTRAIEAGDLEGRRFGKRSWQISVTSVERFIDRRQCRQKKGA